jgi:formate hydrogenlyase subunit 3/multisubunit Na+/H+ antiporter MnhD subunit
MQTLFLAMLIAYSLGVLAALAGGRKSIGRGLVAFAAIAGAGAGLALGATVIASGTAFTLSVSELLPLGGGLGLRLDSLGAFFLIVIGVGAIPAALYGWGYSAAYEDGRVSLRLLGAMFNLFLLTMSLVTLADNVLTFLLMWEAMSLTSYLLVIAEADEERTRSAGLWYIAMTHVGLMTLLAAFLLFGGPAGLGAFAELRAIASSLSRAFGTPCSYWRSLALARRLASSHCMCGCRARIRPRPVMSPL